MKKIRKRDSVIVCLDLSTVNSGYVFKHRNRIRFGSIKCDSENIVDRSYQMSVMLGEKLRDFTRALHSYQGVKIFVESVYTGFNPRVTKDLSILCGMCAKELFDFFSKNDPNGDILFEQVTVNSWRGFLFKRGGVELTKEDLSDKKKAVMKVMNIILKKQSEGKYTEITDNNVTDALGLHWYAENRGRDFDDEKKQEEEDETSS